MSEAVTKETVSHVSKAIQEQYYIDTRKDPEESINELLDAILKLKSLLNDRSAWFEEITEELEQLTWFTDPDEEDLELIDKIFAGGKSVYSMWNKVYISSKQASLELDVASAEVKRLKVSLEDFNEALDDVKRVFFQLPNNPEFIALQQELKKL